MTEDGKSVVIGPELEGSLYSYEFAIWGDHAAAVVADEERTVDNLFYLESAIVTRFSDWKTRQVLPSPHSRVVEVALTERHLHVVESPGLKDYLKYREVRRYDLERMDEWGVDVATTP